MLRRFETYGFALDATPERRAELGAVLRDAGVHIPEVLDSAVGHDRSPTPVDLVWEHAYAGPDAYARYMCHPYHICVLDRFLLPEHPECITASRRELRLGLLGYEVEGAPFRVSEGVRRVVALRVDPEAGVRAVERLVDTLNARAERVPEVLASVAAPNTLGLEWFPDGWTHVWEQAFADEASMSASLPDEAALLGAAPIVGSVALWYELEPGAGPGAPPAASGDAVGPGDAPGPEDAPGADPSVVMVDSIEVDPADADAYVDAFRRLYLPGARARGLDLVASWRSPAGVDDVVTVVTAFAVGSWSDWEQARNAAVRDPAMSAWLAARDGLMRRGTRRFHEAVRLDPAPTASAPGEGSR